MGTTTTLNTSTFSSSLSHFLNPPPSHHHHKIPGIGFRYYFPTNSSVSCNSSNGGSSCSADRQRRISSLESLFCYDKAIPEQIIEKPVGLSVAEKEIGDQPPCTDCEAKGAVLCATCSGSGLYVDSIMESQGIIVKVRCLSCGGTGNIMCSECGGRGHV